MPVWAMESKKGIGMGLDGMVIIVQCSFKSTFGANKIPTDNVLKKGHWFRKVFPFLDFLAGKSWDPIFPVSRLLLIPEKLGVQGTRIIV